jgi:hypothetical protein
MKKTILIACLMIFSLGASSAFAVASDSKSTTEMAALSSNKLSSEEMTRLTNRVKEIRSMDKSNLSASEKSDLKKELKGIKETVKKDGGYIYMSGGTLILIIILVIILL